MRTVFCNNTLKGSLTHDGGTSDAASSRRRVNVPVVLYLGAFDGFACYKQVSGLSKTYLGSSGLTP